MIHFIIGFMTGMLVVGFTFFYLLFFTEGMDDDWNFY